MKQTKLISYDLVANRDYSRLIEAIKKLNPQSWCHALKSTWLIPTTMSCAQVRDYLASYIDSDDKLLVVDAGPGWATRGLAKDINDWLKYNLG